MKKEQIKECLENGIKMLEQGKEVEKVQENIINSVQTMLNLKVKTVNICVKDIVLKEEK